LVQIKGIGTKVAEKVKGVYHEWYKTLP
jgi:hypothetical protein